MFCYECHTSLVKTRQSQKPYDRHWVNLPKRSRDSPTFRVPPFVTQVTRGTNKGQGCRLVRTPGDTHTPFLSHRLSYSGRPKPAPHRNVCTCVPSSAVGYHVVFPWESFSTDVCWQEIIILYMTNLLFTRLFMSLLFLIFYHDAC